MEHHAGEPAHSRRGAHGMAKPYQVAQVLELVDRHELEVQ